MQGDDQEPLVDLSYWQELTESGFLQRGFPALPEARKGLAGRLHDRMPPASTVQIYATVTSPPFTFCLFPATLDTMPATRMTGSTALLTGVLALALLLKTATPVRSEDEIEYDKPPAASERGELAPDEKMDRSSKVTGYVDSGHQVISHSVDRLSNWVDDFFGDERTDVESRGTRVRLRTGPAFQENGLERFDFNVDLRVSLPKTEKRLKLVIEGDSEDTPGAAQDSLQRTVEDTDYSASLLLQFKEEVKQNIGVDLGARFTLPVDPFARLRVRRSIFPGQWEVRGVASARYFLEAKFEAVLSLDFDRELTPKHLFRSRTRGDWTEKSEIWNLSHTLALFHTFSDTIGLTTEAAILWDTAEATLSTGNYLARFTFRQRLYHSWIFWEVVPEVQFPRDEGYEITPILNIKLELIFGKGLTGRPS